MRTLLILLPLRDGHKNAQCIVCPALCTRACAPGPVHPGLFIPGACRCSRTLNTQGDSPRAVPIQRSISSVLRDISRAASITLMLAS